MTSCHLQQLLMSSLSLQEQDTSARTQCNPQAPGASIALLAGFRTMASVRNIFGDDSFTHPCPDLGNYGQVTPWEVPAILLLFCNFKEVSVAQQWGAPGHLKPYQVYLVTCLARQFKYLLGDYMA
jgi:hypothetical protein